MANSVVSAGTWMFGCVSTNSPRLGLSVKPATPLPTVSTSIVTGPYSA